MAKVVSCTMGEKFVSELDEEVRKVPLLTRHQLCSELLRRGLAEFRRNPKEIVDSIQTRGR